MFIPFPFPISPGLTFFFRPNVINCSCKSWPNPLAHASSLRRLLTKLSTFCLYAGQNFCLSLALFLSHFSFGQLKSRIMVPLQIPDTCARCPYSMLSILICMQSVKVHGPRPRPRPESSSISV